MSPGNSVLKDTPKRHLKDIFPQSYKAFGIFILIRYILFCRTNQKNVLQNETKDLANL